jgi:sulfide:quinone oxidoreductase
MKMSSESRREFLKRGALLSTLLLSSREAGAAETKLSMPSSKKRARIVIAGGGSGGIDLAHRIRRAAPNARTILISPDTSHSYAAAEVFIAAGLYEKGSNVRAVESLLGDGIEWIEDRVESIEAEKQYLYCEKSGKVSYDILIVAVGCEYDFEAIDGLKREDIGKDGVCSLYMPEGGYLASQWMRSIYSDAKKRELRVIFTLPETAVSGRGVSPDMLFLTMDMLRGRSPYGRDELSEKVKFTLSKAGTSLLGNAVFDHIVEKKIEASGFSSLDDNTLRAVDTGRKIAYFESSSGKREYRYDYIHITPPMSAPSLIGDSSLAVEGEDGGWLDIDPETLHHRRYENIFGIGDVTSIRNKSGAAVRDQAIVIQDNIVAALEGERLPAKYRCYTAVPIGTRYGREIMAEFDRDGFDTTLPLDPREERWLWWFIDLHLMPRLYFDMMLRGMM